jgi:hypothetical protein
MVRIRDLFDAERHNPMSREAAAKLLGFSGITGSSNSMLADLTAYGLLERIGKGEVRVTKEVAQIIYPSDTGEYHDALLRAAMTPSAFQALRERFPDNLPNPVTLEGALVRMGFTKAGLKSAMSAFLETFRYVQEEIGRESNGSAASEVTESTTPDVKSGGAAVGDLIQWESGGALQFETPRRVRWVSEDGAWLAVDGSDTGIPMSQVTLEQAAPPKPPLVPPQAPMMPEFAQAERGFSEWFRAKVGTDKIVTINFKGEGEIGPKEIEKMIRVLEAQKLALED